jgi:CHAT domain-containing protein/Tfp pilus assembly protein PilF
MRVMIRLLLLSAFAAASIAVAEQATADEPVQQLRSLVREGQYAEAERGARELLAHLENEEKVQTATAGAVLDVLVESRWRGGKAFEPETRELAQRAIEVKTRALGADHAELAESLNNLAILHFFGGEYLEAKPLWERAIVLRRNALGPDHPKVAHMMNNLANLLTMIGEYDQARELYEQALAIREEAFGPVSVPVGDTLSNLALLLTNIGDYSAALRVSERAVDVKREALGTEHPKYPSSLSSLGSLLWRMGHFERARPILEEAVVLYEKALGPEHPFVGQALNNLAELLRASGDLKGARQSYERSLAVLEQAYGPEHPEVALTLDNLADLLEETGDDAEAEKLYRRAMAIREAALGEEHPDVAESQLSLGLLLAKHGKTAEALPLLVQSVSIRESALGPAHPQVAEALAGLAALVAATGDSATALEDALRAEEIGRDHLRLTGRSLAEQLAVRYAAVRNRGLDLALSLAAEGMDDAAMRAVLDSLVRSRAVVLDEIAARQRSVAGSEDPEIARLAQELANARAQLANLTVKGLGNMSPEAYRTLLDESRRNKERAENALAAASTAFALERERSRAGLDAVAASLPPDSALIAFVLYDRAELPEAGAASARREQPTAVKVDRSKSVPSYMAMVLRAGASAPAAVPLGPADEIDPLIRKWKREMVFAAGASEPDQAEARYRSAAEALGSKIWSPIVEELAGVARVLIVPDGSINLVSFSSLPVGADGYLVEAGPLVHYLSAERDVVSTSEAITSGKGLLAIGGPAFDGAEPKVARASSTDRPSASRTRSACGSFETLRFDPLPAAEIEAWDVAALWESRAQSGDTPREPAVHLSGAEASEAAFKQDAPGMRVLHLATHGFFLGGECASGLERSRGIKFVEEPAPTAGVQLSPLLLSGLALAGANRRAEAGESEEDGILTAEEIASLDLSGVEWAVLSACDTGVGEIQAGEGVFGLRRAIQVAGVRTLVMSLWPVDDESTRSWMLAFYRARLFDERQTPEALRQASLSVIQQRRENGESAHPFFWAAFVAAGGWQ